jgi:hypothetical protein
MSTRKTKNYLIDAHLKTKEKMIEEWPYNVFSSTKTKQYKIDTVLA